MTYFQQISPNLWPKSEAREPEALVKITYGIVASYLFKRAGNSNEEVFLNCGIIIHDFSLLMFCGSKLDMTDHLLNAKQLNAQCTMNIFVPKVAIKIIGSKNCKGFSSFSPKYFKKH